MNTTYNPIVEARDLPRIRFSVRDLAAKAHTTVVIVTATGEPLAIRPGEQVPQARTGAYREAYFIDITDHQLQFECRLPSKDGAFYFNANVSYRCQVVDPAIVVSNRCTDAAAVIQPVLKRILRGITRQYEPDQSGAAEEEANDELYGGNTRVPGFRVSECVVELSLDGDEAGYVRKRRIARHRQDLDKGELEIVQPLVEAGDVGMLALYLSKHPDDAAAVVDLMKSHDHMQGTQRLEALKVIFNNRDADDDFDMERVRHSIASTIAEELKGRPGLSNPALSRGRLRGTLIGAAEDSESGSTDGYQPPAISRGADAPPRDPDASE